MYEPALKLFHRDVILSGGEAGARDLTTGRSFDAVERNANAHAAAMIP
jgi:hypothetical protein